MNLLDLYENREPHSQAIDRLEARRIEDLNARMADLVQRAREATNPEHKAALQREFNLAKQERDEYYTIKEASDTVKLDPKTGKPESWSHEGDWEKTKNKDPRGQVTHMSDVERRRAEKLADLDEAYDSPLDTPAAKDAREKLARAMAPVKKQHPNHPALRNFKSEVDEAGLPDVVDRKAKMARATPARPGPVSAVKDIVKGLKNFAKGHPETGPTYEATDLKKKTKGRLWQARIRVKNPEYSGFVDAQVWAPSQTVARSMVKSQYNLQNWDISSIREISESLAEHGGGVNGMKKYVAWRKKANTERGITKAPPPVGRPSSTGRSVPQGTVHSKLNLSKGVIPTTEADLDEHGGGGGGPREWHNYVKAHRADEGWSDAIVAQRTGRPRTPYSVFIKGKKWKDFETDDHAEAVANKLRAKFKAEGRDPSVITIAPTDYNKGMTEAPGAETLAHNQSTVASNEKAMGLAETQKENPMTAQDLEDLIAQARQRPHTEFPELHHGDEHEINGDRDELTAEETMQQAAGNPTGPKFGGYYRGDQKGPPRPGQSFGGCEESVDNDSRDAVESAIIRRIMVAHTDLLMKFGPQKTIEAAAAVADDVGDVDEIGTSDVSAWVHQVERYLAMNY